MNLGNMISEFHANLASDFLIFVNTMGFKRISQPGPIIDNILAKFIHVRGGFLPPGKTCRNGNNFLFIIK
jgi:hypothetical protein